MSTIREKVVEALHRNDEVLDDVTMIVWVDRAEVGYWSEENLERDDVVDVLPDKAFEGGPTCIVYTDDHCYFKADTSTQMEVVPRDEVELVVNG